MRLKFAVALVSAALLGFSCAVPKVWAHGGWGGSGGHSFGGHSFGGHNFGGHNFGGHNFGGHNFSHHNFGAHRNFSSHGIHYNHLTHHNNFQGIHNKNNFVHQHPHYKNQVHHATFSKANFWSNSRWGGHWNHFHPWYRWYGGVFWPYFFGDYFCYGFWPDYCYDAYWGYGPDVLLWGAFWPYGDGYYDDAADYDDAYEGQIYEPYQKQAAKAEPDPKAVAETCTGFAPGVSDLPVQKFEGIIDATGEQRAALDDLKGAVAKASDILKKACPAEPPLTPVARLDAMEQRLQAMEEANAVVKGPFIHFYSVLTDQQKQRLEAISKPSSKRQLARAKDVNVAGLCSSQAGFTSVPADRIASTIKLTAEQQQELDKLKAASEKASDDLKNSCPASMPDTLDGRLDAAQQRVTALIGAVDTVKPAVKDFYTSLTDEQKAALSIQGSPQNHG